MLQSFIHHTENQGATPSASGWPDQSAAVDQLNSFLRGEISATETYRMAIESMINHETSPVYIAVLRKIQAEHIRATNLLRERILEMKGEPVDSSGTWGTWARFAIGTAQLFGDIATLRALKDGEEHGAKDFAAGLDNLDHTSAELIRNRLMASVDQHMTLLDRLVSDIGHRH